MLKIPKSIKDSLESLQHAYQLVAMSLKYKCALHEDSAMAFAMLQFIFVPN